MMTAPPRRHGDRTVAPSADRPRLRYGADMSSIHDLRMTGIDGETVDFDRFRGQVLVVVNVASA